MRNLLLGAAALLAACVAAPGAWAASGHVDVSYARSDVEGADVDVFGAGGVVAFDANALGVQLDFDYANADADADDDADLWNIGAHLYSQSNTWLFGGYVGFGNVDVGGGDSDEWNIALETQYYLRRTTLGAALVYGEAEDFDLENWSVEGDVKHFYNDNFSVNANVAFGNADVGFADSDMWRAGLGGEFQFAQLPMSIYGGYQHNDFDDFGESDAVGVGVRWNWGGETLFDRNRSGGDLKRRSSIAARALGIV